MVGRHDQVQAAIIIRNRRLVFDNLATWGKWWTADAIAFAEEQLAKIPPLDELGVTLTTNEWLQMEALYQGFIIIDTNCFGWDLREFERRVPGVIAYVKKIRDVVGKPKEWKKIRGDGISKYILQKFKAKVEKEGEFRIKFATNNGKVYKNLNRLILLLDFSKFPTEESLNADNGLVCGIRFAPKEKNQPLQWGQSNLGEFFEVNKAVIDAYSDDEKTGNDDGIERLPEVEEQEQQQDAR